MKYKKIVTSMVLVLCAPFTVITPVMAAECAGVETSIIDCPTKNKSTKTEDNGVWQLLLIVINILTAGIGITAVGGIIYASVLYASAEDKSDQVNQAKDLITNVVIGLIMFAVMWSLLNFLIPGGVFT